jgi:hypothetical protein
MFASFDDSLIERVFQPVADFLLHHLSLGRSGAACLCVDVASVGWILARARALSAAVLRWDAGASFLDLIVLLLGLLALISLRTLFRRTSGKPNANPLRLVMRPHRAVVLLMLAARAVQLSAVPSGLADLGDVADVAMLLFGAAALYLGACTERPPLKRVCSAMAGSGAR